MERWKWLLKTGASLMGALVYLGSLPGKIHEFVPLYAFFSTHWHNLLFRTLVFAVLIPSPFAFEIFDFFRPRVKVALDASGGASSELFLRVTNLNRRGNFWATCEVVGSKGAKYPTNRTVALKWEGTITSEMVIAINCSANLLIASHGRDSHNIAWLRLWHLGEKGEQQLTAVAWEQIPAEQLPELYLRINLFKDQAVNPYIAYFTLRPVSYVGPLEMFAIPAEKVGLSV